MTEQEQNKLKLIQLDMLKEFINVCETENLQWFVVGGTALGTVRHKGFIPWDDDIDVAMPREDYEKFLAVAQSYFPKHLFLQNFQTDKEYPMNFAKIRNSNTTFIESSCATIKMNHGIYLDVFPLDGFPKNELEGKIFLLRDRLLKIRIGSIFAGILKLQRNTIRKIVDFILKIIYPDLKSALLKREKLIKKYSYENSFIVANYCGAWGKKEIMKREVFGNGIKGFFEEIEVILPEKCDEYLTRLYGDYMQLPPLEKRVAHHYCNAIDFEKSYLEYVKDENE